MDQSEYEQFFNINFINFTPQEFYCSCCDSGFMDLYFLSALQRARSVSKLCFQINSGFRCVKHNDSIPGASKHSFHLLGQAADISTHGFTTKEKFDLLTVLMRFFNGIGIYQDFIHVDARGTLLRAMWVA